MGQRQTSTQSWRSAVIVTVGMLAGTAYPAVPTASSSIIAQGRYLADAAHCDACHTADPARPYAGNRAMQSKFGTMYSSNITPDPRTGIGRWTESDFTSALRQGKGRHGEYLYPAMPYTDFTKVSDSDVHALWAYFRTVKPIVEEKKDNRMGFPFNVRPGIAAWQAIYFKPGRYVPDPGQSDQWNRGAYLVQGLGHCGACHTPRNFAMASKAGHALQGGDTGDWWFAPDISGSRLSGIRDWSEPQIVDYLRQGHNGLNVSAVGPMLETVAKGTSKLTDPDLQAIAFYLKHQQPELPASAPPAVAMTATQRADGASLYSEHCESCHAADGKGTPGIAPALAGNTAVTSANAETVVHAVMKGFAPQGPWGAMPSFAAGLGNREIADVANYVRSAWGGGAAANADERQVAHMRLDVDALDPRVESALICPPVPASSSDPTTVGTIDALAIQGDAAVPRGLLSEYRARHPGLSASDAITQLSGLYCRALMKDTGERQTSRQMRFIRFTSGISTEATAHR